MLCLGGVDGGLVGVDDRFRVEAVPSPAEPTPEAVAETIPDRPFDCLVFGDSIPQHGEHSEWDVLATVGAVRERFPDRPVAVVDDYGGRLAHESRSGGGSVLIVRLQKAPSAPTASESSAGTS